MLFSQLPEDMQETLRENAPPRSFAAGSLIQHRGDDAEGFWLIDSGSVAIGQFLADGEFRAVGLLGPGDSYGELAMFANRPKTVDAVARQLTVARLVRSEDMEAALTSNPAAMRRLLAGLSMQLQEMIELIAGIRRGTAGGRIAGMLANLSGGGREPKRLDLTQQELAELLGLTRATVNDTLRKLEGNGLIVRGYGCVTVLDPLALRTAELD